MGSKVAILAPFRGANFGTLLQAFALSRYLHNRGVDSEYVNYTSLRKSTFLERVIKKIRRIINSPRQSKLIEYKGIDNYSFMNKPPYKEWQLIMDAFSKQHIPYSNMLYNDLTIRQCNKVYDSFIVGSDQTWSIERNAQYALYYLPFAPTNKPLFSYAPSFGTAALTKYHTELILKYLPKFALLSCREKTNADSLSRLLQKPVSYVLDPTMLLNKKQWGELLEPISGLPQKYILVYALGEREDVSQFAERISQQQNIPIYYILTRPKYESKENVLSQLNPFQFLYAISHASTIITDSFHGTLFSINFEKEFYSFYKRNAETGVLNDNDRMDELLSTFHLHDRLIKYNQDVKYSYIDYKNIRSIVDILRQKSYEYIDQIIDIINTKNG